MIVFEMLAMQPFNGGDLCKHTFWKFENPIRSNDFIP